MIFPMALSCGPLAAWDASTVICVVCGVDGSHSHNASGEHKNLDENNYLPHGSPPGLSPAVPLSGENGFFFTANRSRCWHGEDVVLGSNNHEEDCLANLHLGQRFRIRLSRSITSITESALQARIHA